MVLIKNNELILNKMKIATILNDSFAEIVFFLIFLYGQGMSQV